MPIAFDQMNAKLSGYQGNGPLNALVHVLVDKMGVIPADAVGPNPVTTRADLCAAFHAEWGTYLDWNQLQAVLTATTDPMHREMLLGPVLRRLLPDEGQGGDSATEVSVDAVATLGKRFGIRVEAYQDYAGLSAEIREKLLKKHPDIEKNPEALRHLADQAFKRALGPEIKRRFMAAPDHLPEAEAIARAAHELQSILAGNPPHFPTREQVDLVGIPDPDRLAEGGTGHLATLSLHRVADGYRFGKSDHGTPNVNTFGTAVHNLSQGYKTPCEYAQAAPVLREQLRAAVTTAVKTVATTSNSATDIANRQTAITTAMQNKTSELFSAYQAGPAKAGKTGDAAKGGLGGMMDGLLGNVSTFFGEGDVFGSLKGIMGMIGGIFEPIMKMLMGFQETMSESAKQPGDPLSKKEIDKYAAESAEMGKAASDFSIRVEALGESTSAKAINEAWRQDPNSIGVWASLIDKLVAEGELVAATDCLSNQERRLLEKLTAIAASSEDTKKRTIEATIATYKGAIEPLAYAMSHPNAENALKQESLMARSHLFKELHISADELSSKHARFTEATTKKGKLEVDKALVDSELATATTAGATNLVARFTAAQATLTSLLAENTQVIADSMNFTTRFSLETEPRDQRWFAGSRTPLPPTTNLGQCAAVAEKVRVAVDRI